MRPPKQKDIDGVHESLKVMKQYRLMCKEIDSLLEPISWPKHKNFRDSVDGKMKAVLTRVYNKVYPYSYSAVNVTKKNNVAISKKIKGLVEDEEEAQMSDIVEEDDDKSEKNVNKKKI